MNYKVTGTIDGMPVDLKIEEASTDITPPVVEPAPDPTPLPPAEGDLKAWRGETIYVERKNEEGFVIPGELLAHTRYYKLLDYEVTKPSWAGAKTG